MRYNKKSTASLKSTNVALQYRKQSRANMLWRQFKKNKGAVSGLVLIVVIILIAVASNFIWDYDNKNKGMNSLERLLSPSLSHPFGTDHMGRDVLARVCYGARYSLLIGFSAVSISMIFGAIIGSIAGYYGGRVESIIMRIVELFLMIPAILLVIIFVSVFGTSLLNLIIGLGASTIPHFARNARASVMTVRGSEFVEAAKAVGASDLRIIFDHVLPNAFSPILVQATTRIASCIIDAAAFSFLGLGVPAPLPEWGAMLADARQFLRDHPNLTVAPGVAIMLTVFAVNLIGDGLRDALDPKLKK
jgi:peptide/nickel transport system permease protein